MYIDREGISREFDAVFSKETVVARTGLSATELSHDGAAYLLGVCLVSLEVAQARHAEEHRNPRRSRRLRTCFEQM